MNRAYRKIAKLASLCIVFTMLVNLSACSFSKFDTFRLYSEVKKEAYSGKKDIKPKEKGVYMKTVAGFLNCLDERDQKGVEGFCSKKLLSMDGSREKIEGLVDSFEGDIIDTTPLATDISARKFEQWSKTEPVVYFDDDFIIYTDEETYWVSFSFYSICKSEPDGDDLVGINRLRVLTLDRRFEMQRDAEDLGEDHFIDKYSFRDGTTAEMELQGNCGILISLGDSSDYIAVNTAKGSSYNVFMLTGCEDEISEKELKAIDYTDEEETYETFMSYEPYAKGEESSTPNIISHTWLYSIKGSDDKLYVHFLGNEEEGVRVTYVRRMDITKLLTKQNAKILYDD